MEQSKKSQITKEKILEAAEKEFSEKGLGASRVDEIALSAGVNKRMVYAHFQSKDGLYKSVLKTVYARIADFENKLLDVEFDSADSIKKVIFMYFDFLMKNESFVRLLLWENLEYARNLDIDGNVLFEGIERLLEKGKEKGFVRGDVDVKQTAMSCNLFCFSAFSNVHTLSKIMGENLYSDEEMNKRCCHIADVLSHYIVKNCI